MRRSLRTVSDFSQILHRAGCIQNISRYLGFFERIQVQGRHSRVR